MTQNLKLNTKLNHLFFGTLTCIFHPQSSDYSRKCHHFFFFFFENAYFTLSPSSSSSIHNIVITINTPTTMNNQFEALNAPKNRFTLFLSQFLWTKNNISFTFSTYSLKKTQDFDSKIFMLHRAIEAYDSCWVTFVWDSECLEKTYVG